MPPRYCYGIDIAEWFFWCFAFAKWGVVNGAAFAKLRHFMDKKGYFPLYKAENRHSSEWLICTAATVNFTAMLSKLLLFWGAASHCAGNHADTGWFHSNTARKIFFLHLKRTTTSVWLFFYQHRALQISPMALHVLYCRQYLWHRFLLWKAIR